MIKVLIVLVAISVCFAQNPDYAANLFKVDVSTPYLVIDPFNFGDRAYTFMMHFKINALSGTRALFHAYSETFREINGDDTQVKLILINGATLRVTFGPNQNVKDVPISGLVAGAMNSLAITVEDGGSNSLLLNVYINGALKTTVNVPGRITRGFRSATVGAETRLTDRVRSNYIDGEVDNIIISNHVVTAGTIANFKNDYQYVAPDELIKDLSLYINFNDATQALENTVIAVTRNDGAQSAWVTASIIGGGSYVRHYSGLQWDSCFGSGDVHIYAYANTYGQPHVAGGEHLNGQYVLNVCPVQDFEVRIFARYTVWWAATVTRAATVKVKDYLWRANLDELHSSPDDTYPGTAYCRLGVPAGTFMKKLTDSAWTAWGGTNIHAATGVRYSTNGANMIIQVPDVATYQVNLNGRYMDSYITINTAACRREEGTKGWCHKEIYISGNIFFDDWRSPPALPDVAPPSTSPCDNVDPALKTRISQSCSAYYTVGSDMHGDCMYDACTSGDADIIPTVDLPSECLHARLTGGDVSSCTHTRCQGSCYGRGTCNEATGICTGCDAGFSGNDCYQRNSFNCHTVSYGNSELNIEPKEVLTAASVADNLLFRFPEYSVWKSLLIYPSSYQGKEYLQFVASSPDNSLGGSFQVCITQSNTADANPGAPVFVNTPSTLVKVAGSMTLSGAWAGNQLCVSVAYTAFTVGGFYIPIENKHDLTITVTGANNLDQVLVASRNNKLGMDVARIPNAHWATGFSYEIGFCDNTVCTAHDGDCFTCYKTAGCGYCIESGRCMLGAEYGPKRGFCSNWRFNLDADVSRVVTTKYNGDDNVDPDYEVFLSSVAAGSRVPVNVYVPVGRTNNNLDVMFAFGTSGSFPINAASLRTNLMNTISSLGDINLGISYYGDLGSLIQLSLTRVATQNQYIFSRAMEVPTSGVHTNGATGGQFNLLRTIAGEFGQNAGYRQFSRKLLVALVYDTPADDATALAAARTQLLKRGILPVWLVVDGSSPSVAAYYKALNNRIDGIPSITLSVDAAGANMAQVFRTLLTLSASFPHVVVTDPNDSQYSNVDIPTVQAESDSLNILGLTNTGLRARFVIPMRQGDDANHKVATITIPGFGTSKVEDVPAQNPIARDRSVVGRESDTCVAIRLEGTTYKQLFAPAYLVTSLPTSGSLYHYDPKATNFIGAPVVEDEYFVNTRLCFVPVKYEYSIPSTSPYATFTYQATDGCQYSTDRTVSIIIEAVPEVPVSQDHIITIYETEQTAPIPISIVAFEADKNADASPEQVDFYYFESVTFIRDDFFSALPRDFFYDVDSNSPLSFITPYTGFVPDVNYEATHELEYRAPSVDFFGDLRASFQVIDQSGGKSSVYRLAVNVIGINDAPFPAAELSGYPSHLHQVFQEDNEYKIQFVGRDIDNFGIEIEVFIQSMQTAGTIFFDDSTTPVPTGSWVSACVGGRAEGQVACHLTVRPNANENSCGGMFPPTEPFTEAQIISLCTSPYATLKWRVRDHNNQWLDAPGGSIQEAFSVEQTVNIHVMAVNDRPVTPTSVVVDLIEDNPAVTVDVLVEDIDSIETFLNLWLADIPSADVLTLEQTSGVAITSAPVEIFDFNLKRFQQNHRFVINTVANVHGGSKEDGWVLTTFQMYSSDTDLRSTDNAFVTVKVRPVNDAPYNLASSFVKPEDSIGDVNWLELTADDIDTRAENLVYVITELPYFDLGLQLPEGILIRPIDLETGLPSEFHLTSADLPYTVQLDSENRAFVYVENARDWYGVSETKLVYTVTDKDEFLSVEDTGYLVNTVEGQVTLTITPVNDNPRVTQQPPTTFEDTFLVFALLGESPAFHEADLDILEVVVDDIVVTFSDDYEPETFPDVFFQYDADLETGLLTEGPTTTAGVRTPLKVGDEVSDTIANRVIYIPPQHMNVDESRTQTPLFIEPKLRYKMVETYSHASPLFLISELSDYVNFQTLSVNDKPVTWGDETWNVDSAYEFFYGPNEWPYPAGHGDDAEDFNNVACIDECYYTEDFGADGFVNELTPREIFFGGRDVEGDDLTVRIYDVDCVEGAEFFIINETTRTAVSTAALSGATLARTLSRTSVGYGLTALLTFRPAINSWNIPSEGHANDLSSTERDTYCTFSYTVTDEEGLESDPKVINIYVKQRNDQPLDSILVGEGTSILTGYEDRSLRIKFDAFDIESDDFEMRVTECGSRGSFYNPSDNQHNFINDLGVLDPSVSDAEAFDLENPIDCSDLSSYTSRSYSETDNKGWYLLFVPVANDYRNDYNKIFVQYDDGILSGQAVSRSSRTINIRPVNDAPVLTMGGITLVSGSTDSLTVARNSAVSLNLGTTDVDAITTDASPQETVMAFRLALTKATASREGDLTVFNVPSDLSGFGTIKDVQVVAPSSNSTVGYIQFVGTQTQATQYLQRINLVFPEGSFELEFVVHDRGFTGYCPPDIVKDKTKYVLPDIRKAFGAEGSLVPDQEGVGKPEMCNRVSSVVIQITSTSSMSLIAGPAAGAGAAVAALGLLGAVVYAKLKKPKDMDAWQALDGAMGANTMTSGIHVQAGTSGQSGIYQGR